MFRAGEGAFARLPSKISEIVDNDAAQTAAASASEPSVETPGQAVGGPAPSSSGGHAPAAGRPAPEDVSMEAAESSAVLLCCRRVRWFGRWKLGTMQAQNVRS